MNTIPEPQAVLKTVVSAHPKTPFKAEFFELQKGNLTLMVLHIWESDSSYREWCVVSNGYDNKFEPSIRLLNEAKKWYQDNEVK